MKSKTSVRKSRQGVTAFRRGLTLVTCALFISGQVGAATATWNVGSGSWNRTANWTPTAVPGGSVAGDTANFNIGAGAAKVVTLDNGLGTAFSPVLSNLNVTTAGNATAGLTLNAGSGGVLTMAAGGTIQWGTGSGTGNTNVIGANVLMKGALNFNLSGSASAPLLISGAIGDGGGGFGVTLSGSGATTFQGANSYTGTTTVNSGTLNLNRTGGAALAGGLAVSGGTVNLLQGNQLASTKAVTVSAGSLNIGSNNTAVNSLQITGGSITGTSGVLTSSTAYDVQAGSVSAILGGTVGLNKTGAGNATLSAANTYSGTTTISAGKLSLNSASGNAISGDVTISGGTLELLRSNQIADTKSVSVSGGTFSIGANSETVGALQVTGGGTLQGTTGVLTSTTAVDAQNGTISAKLGGTAGLNKTSVNAVTLSGANTYSGTTNVSGGTLNLNTTGAPAVNGNVVVSGTGTLVLQQSSQIAATKTLTVSAGNVNIGANSNTLGALQLTGGNISGTTGVVTSTSNYDFQSGSVSAILGGTVGLNKTTSGAVTLSGVNTFTGTTTVTSGTLNLSATTGPALAGNVIVNGGTLVPVTDNQVAASKTITVNSGVLNVGSSNQNVAGLKVVAGGVQGTSGVITSSTDFDIQSGTISAKLGGSVGLNKTGTGSASLSGVNTFTGTTTVSAGTLNLNANGTALAGKVVINGGSLSLLQNNQISSSKTVSISSGNFALSGRSNTVAGLTVTGGSVSSSTGVLTSTTPFDVQAGTISARLGGSVGLNKTGAGTATLSGFNSFTGDTVVSAGTLNLNVSGGQAMQGNLIVNLGGTAVFQQNQQLPASKTVTVSGGTLDMGTKSTNVAGLKLTGTGLITGSGTLTSTTAHDLQGGTVAAILGGNVGANVTTGTVTFSNQNTYSGLTHVSNNGTLVLSSSGGPAISGDLLIDSTATVQVKGDNQLLSSKQMLLNGGTFDAGIFKTSVAGLSLSSNASIVGSGTITSAGSFLLQSGQVNAVLAGTASATVTNGTVLLEGNNTYTGLTQITNKGTLQLDGSIAAASGVFLETSGTLTGSGTVGGSVALEGGTLAMKDGKINGSLQSIGGTLSGSVTVNGVVTQLAGTFDVTEGSLLIAKRGVSVIGGTFGVAGTVDGSMAIDNAGTLVLSSKGVVSGTVTIGKGSGNINGTGQIGGLNLVDQSNLHLGTGAQVILGKGGLVSVGSASVNGGMLLAGSSGLQVYTGGTLTLGSDLYSTGGLVKTGTGVLNLQGTASLGGAAVIQQGTLTLDGTLQAPQLILNPGTTFNGSGNLLGTLVNNGGTFNPGHSPGTLSISGDFRQTRNGTLVLQVQNSSTFDRVIATGTVHLAGALNVQDWRGHKFAYGDIVPDFIQAGHIDGHFATITMPSANLRGRIVNDGQNLSLVAAPASYTLVAQTPNQLQVARALDHWIGKESGDVGLVTLALDVQTASEYPRAFNAIGPAYYSVLPRMGIEQAAAQNSLMQQRFSEIHTEVQRATMVPHATASAAKPSPAPASTPTGRGPKPNRDKDANGPASFAQKDEPWTTWIQTGGQFAQLQTLQTLADSHFDGLSAVVGLDHRLGSESAAGIAVGYNYSDLAFDHGDRTTVDSGRVSIYGVAGLGNGFFLDGAVTGGYTNYDVKRPVQFSVIDRIARGRTDGSELSAAVQFGKDFHLGKWTVTPKMGFQYSRVHINGLNESNAGALNLVVNGYGAQSMRGTLGAMVAYQAKLSDKVTLVPYLTASWQHEFDSPTETVRAALPADGGSFRYNGGSFGDDRMQAGAGFILNVGDNTTLNLGYQAEFGSGDYESHMIMLMMSYRF